MDGRFPDFNQWRSRTRTDSNADRWNDWDSAASNDWWFVSPSRAPEQPVLSQSFAGPLLSSQASTGSSFSPSTQILFPQASSSLLNPVPLITVQPKTSLTDNKFFLDATSVSPAQTQLLSTSTASPTSRRADFSAFGLIDSAGGIVLLAGIAVLILILIVAILVYSYFRVQKYQREKRHELRKRVRFNEELANLPLSAEDEDDYGSSGRSSKATMFVEENRLSGSSNPATFDTASPYADPEAAGGGGWSWLQIWTRRQADYNARGYTEVRDMAHIPGYTTPFYNGSDQRPQGGGARIDSLTSSLQTKSTTHTTHSQSGHDMGTLTSSALSQLEAQRSPPPRIDRSQRQQTNDSLYSDVALESAKTDDTVRGDFFNTTPRRAGDSRSTVTITTITTTSNPASGVSGEGSLYTPNSATTPTITRLGLAGSRMSMSPTPNAAAAFLKAKTRLRSEDGSGWSETSSVNWEEEEVEVSEYNDGASWAAKSDGSNAFSTLLREYEGGSIVDDQSSYNEKS
ncbi:hypothetical protein HK096_006650 [Nowakowskiella sp. JEL0078]|nr:hypothetical protein HK096_006650 [Nowakowskiella sp. JEL0078]